MKGTSDYLFHSPQASPLKPPPLPPPTTKLRQNRPPPLSCPVCGEMLVKIYEDLFCPNCEDWIGGNKSEDKWKKVVEERNRRAKELETINACEKGMLWETALGMMQKMPRQVIQPDTIICSAASSLTDKSM